MSDLTFGPIHELFLEDETAQIEIEGARYSAKTWTCSAKVLRATKKYHGIRALACRYSNEESKTKIKTVLQYEVAPRMGIDLKWSEDEKAFTVPTTAADSKIFCHGLKAQSRQEELAKVRGLDVGILWNDQTEEDPQAIVEELPFATRQEGFPHQLILSPNPPDESHFLADMFPEECSHLVAPEKRPFPHRVLYRLSLYDNPHCPKDKLAELEAAFPITHAKYKSLILGLRGPNITGTPVYEHLFNRAEHVGPTHWTPSGLLLEAVQGGQHHPVWLAAQRTALGGLEVLGGIQGKKLFLEDFLPVVQRYRSEWFEGTSPLRYRTCADPPPNLDQATQLAPRYSTLDVIRAAGMRPMWRQNANAPDVREAVIQHIAGQMRRRGDFMVNQDPERWLMVSSAVTKHTKYFIDSLEGSFVWDENFVSVGNKRVRQPKMDQWLDPWMRCLENIVLNFCAGHLSEDEMARRRRDAGEQGEVAMPSSPHAWMF